MRGAAVRERLERGSLQLYLGICAGAFLGSAKPGNLGLLDVGVFDEKHFGYDDVKGAAWCNFD